VNIHCELGHLRIIDIMYLIVVPGVERYSG